MTIFTVADSEILLRLVMAIILCGLIGLINERQLRLASIRTNALIGLATALFALASLSFSQLVSENSFNTSQIAAAAIIGISLFGSAVIIQSRGIVKGITTAAAIWIVAAIGLVTGLGLYGPAIITTVLTTLIITILRQTNLEEDGTEKKETNMPR